MTKRLHILWKIQNVQKMSFCTKTLRKLNLYKSITDLHSLQGFAFTNQEKGHFKMCTIYCIMKVVGSERNGPGVITVVEFLLVLKCYALHL